MGDVYVSPMGGGAARRVTDWSVGVGGVVWTPDGRDLIYAKGDLWRISADRASPGRGTRLEIASLQAGNLSISRPRTGQPAKLAFQTLDRDLGFRIVDLQAPLHMGVFRAVKPFIAPDRTAYPGPFSPDGRRFAFISGTPPQLWIAASDGTALKQVTSVKAAQMAAGGWSPDGGRIAYEATIDGNTEVYVVDAGGGPSRRLTTEPSADFAPSWSRDSRWVYFSSFRAGPVADLWRVPSGRRRGGPRHLSRRRAGVGVAGRERVLCRPGSGSGFDAADRHCPVDEDPGRWWARDDGAGRRQPVLVVRDR